MNILNPTLKRSALAAVLLGGTALGGFAVGHTGQAATVQETQGQPVNPPGAVVAHNVPDFSDLVSKVRPAVVQITSKLNPEQAGEGEGEGGQVPFPFNQMPGGRPQQRHMVEARGSGFIVDANGTVVTNNHVVNGAKSVTVTLDDGTTLPAKIVGRDPRTDVAVLRVSAKKTLPYIELGDSSTVKPGQWVVAMGNPFGLGGTVTAGIVSALGRDIGNGPYDHFIQIDAPINQGNSGGPLFTQDGKVVGINTAILSPSGGSIGIGFAIPSNTVKTVVADLETSGHVTRGYIGVEAQTVSDAMAKALHVAGSGGALIAGVTPDSPAAKAGLEPGDVIQSVNGQKIGNPRDLALNVAAVKPGDEAKFDVLRDGEHKVVTGTVAEQPSETKVADNSAGQQEGHAKLGVALAPVSPEAREQFDLPGDAKGALVAQVQPGSPAEQAGIQAGDLIVGIGGHAVGSPDDAVTAIRTAKDHELALRIIRNGQPAFVAVNLDKTENSEG
ncbi:MAG: trypsin-like peptidase domain-containing protein [Alphaproteobacteria bacterium]|nr:trypsin-like peptidase domain-containing protein [Alphaproteobacteria bacterium]